MTLDLLLTGGLVVLPDVGIVHASIGVRDGRIAALFDPADTVAARETVDCRDRWVMPGLVDPHVHFGFGSPETDFLTESRSAALGGVTTVLTFHRSADLRESVPKLLKQVAPQVCIDFGLHFGLTSHLHVDTLVECTQRFGVPSYKMYMMYKGQAGLAKGFTEIDDGLLFAAMREAARVPGAVLGVHCENVELLPVLRDPLRRAGRADLVAWDEQSPDFVEAENVHRVCYFAARTGCAVNIVHLSSAEALAEARRHRTPGRPPIHVETCPHYLALTHHAPTGVLAKANPPLRSQANVDALWQGVVDGSIQTVGTDHVPRKRETKQELWSASQGMPGVATMLPLLIHEGYHRRGVPIERIAAVTSANAARIYRLPMKGQIAIGMDADLVVVDPDLERIVDPAQLASYSDYSPFEGMKLKGWPVLTLVRGMTVAAQGRIREQAMRSPAGRYLPRQ